MGSAVASGANCWPLPADDAHRQHSFSFVFFVPFVVDSLSYQPFRSF
jgi:hypothetical protein